MNLRFESRVHDDDTFTVWAIDRAPGHATDQHAWHIADIFFNGGEWLFIKYNLTGEIDHGSMRWIDADHAQWSELRAFTNLVNKDRHKRTEPELAALDTMLATQRREFRDDTREDARLWGIALARVWAKSLFDL